MSDSKGQAPLVPKPKQVPKFRAYCVCSFIPYLSLDVPGFCHQVSASHDSLAPLESTVSPLNVDGFCVVPLFQLRVRRVQECGLQLGITEAVTGS